VNKEVDNASTTKLPHSGKCFYFILTWLGRYLAFECASRCHHQRKAFAKSCELGEARSFDVLSPDNVDFPATDFISVRRVVLESRCGGARKFSRGNQNLMVFFISCKLCFQNGGIPQSECFFLNRVRVGRQPKHTDVV